jgi:nucleoid-associated protein YgaU
MASPIRVFTITELRRTGAGDLAPTLRQFRWDSESHTAPREAIEVELAVKTIRREQPGAEEPVEQVISSTWQPFDLDGEWNDKHAGRGYAMATYREFSRFVQGAPLVRLEFEQLSLTGLITSLTPRYEHATKVGWRLTFSPHTNDAVGRARPAQRITQPTSKPVREHVAVAKEIAADLELDNTAARTIPTSDTTFLDSAADIAVAVANVSKVEVAASAGLETEAGQKLLNLAGQFRTIGQSGLTVSRRLRGARSQLSAGFDNPVLWLKFDEAVHTTAARGLLLTGAALQADADMRARADARPRAVHRPFAGENLQRIALKYYGVASEWRRIYEANGLSSLVLDGTEELTIPSRQA